MADDAAVELGRVVERFRTMPLTRLEAPWPPHASRAAAARSLAQWLADRAARLGGWGRHEVPDVGMAAVGDQLAVTGADLLALDPPPAERGEMAERLRQMRLSL